MMETEMEWTEITDRSGATFGEDSGSMLNPSVPWMSRIEEHSAWPKLSGLELMMAVEVPLLRFKVQDLLGLSEGQVFESAFSDTEDVPLRIGGVQLGWTEFEVVDQKIALRLTRLV
ncbi:MULTISPECIES: FliM/FliN family flagellar motor C-terminal domain-containing protein [Acidobacteriaceae]|uniref:FliM/FliN family flagellar motor C-terminal domain-containing protein n=1 Tax=Acidobacteriaceae TaxID=204434 RepID=UPI00131D3C72|nr:MULTISPECIES: FliM/FliN family flagellar motor C-terminal domain-containing protein [Acidobacteriaceae]MDW5264316.1 FliM/FliN family flagellar motor C-terminal domain-containing protein [Edaphobacter sp.]